MSDARTKHLLLLNLNSESESDDAEEDILFSFLLKKKKKNYQISTFYQREIGVDSLKLLL